MPTYAPIRECPNCNCDMAVRTVFAPSFVWGPVFGAPTGTPEPRAPEGPRQPSYPPPRNRQPDARTSI